MIAKPSPHHSPRTSRPIRCIVLHADAGSSEHSTLAWLADPSSDVSYHVLIGRRGTAYRCVDDERAAWHAGKAEYQGESKVNSISLGIAFANRNDGEEPYTAEQLDAARVIVADWCRRYGLHPAAITTHAVVARPAGRKTDPVRFDLEAFRASVTRTLLDP